jgi:hypothetical protein
LSDPLDIVTAVLGSEMRAREVFGALASAGWVCVPREPTAEMLDAAFDYIHAEDGTGTWRAMVAQFQSS